MKTKTLIFQLMTLGVLSWAQLSSGQAIYTWVQDTGDFFEDLNWDQFSAPGATDIAVINNGGTATIKASDGDVQLGALRLGNVSGGTENGHVIMNGGFLRLGETAGDPKAVIGFSAVLSTFIMNGGTIFFDGPDLFPGNKAKAGVNNLDWEVGEGGYGRFEMHNDALFRAGDDLKIAEAGAGHGTCLIDGNAVVSVGSGISLSSGGPDREQSMVIAGHALVESGNSMGAGNPDGSTDEGYLTMAIGNGNARFVIQDSAILNIRVLTAREGISTMIVKDHGQFHIYDVYGGTAPNHPIEAQFNSSYGSAPASDLTRRSTLTLQDDAQMSVNNFVDAKGLGGLSIGGPRDQGNAGGQASLIVRDRASFTVEQYLGLGDGAAASSDGILTVRGPDATVAIHGDLNLAVSPVGAQLPGKGTFHSQIIGSTHATVTVGGTARLANGTLKISFKDGYIPKNGDSYTLLRANALEGQFKEIDTTEAAIVGLTYDVSYPDNNRVVLDVSGTALLSTIGKEGNNIRISWPPGFPDFILEVNTSGVFDPAEDPFNWLPVPGVTGNQAVVPADGVHKFFRLRKP